MLRPPFLFCVKMCSAIKCWISLRALSWLVPVTLATFFTEKEDFSLFVIMASMICSSLSDRDLEMP